MLVRNGDNLKKKFAKKLSILVETKFWEHRKIRLKYVERFAKKKW